MRSAARRRRLPRPWALALGADSTSEGDAESVSLTVSITNGVTFAQAQTVRLTLGGDAAAGADYTVSATALVLPAGASSVRAEIVIVDDADAEAAETIEVVATHDGREIGRASVEIVDDDNAAPAVSSLAVVSAPGGADIGLADSYVVAETVRVAVTFDRAVTVDSSAGLPSLGLDVNGRTETASFEKGEGSASMVFRWTVVPGPGGVTTLADNPDNDTDGIAVAADALQANDAAIGDPDTGTPADLSHPALPDQAAHKVLRAPIQPLPADALAMRSTPAAGAVYGAGEEIRVALTFTGPVLVEGTPLLALDLGGTARQVAYSAGSGTRTLEFAYTVQAGDLDEDGLSVADGAAPTLDDATVTDSRGGPTVLTVPLPGLVDLDGHRVDGGAADDDADEDGDEDDGGDDKDDGSGDPDPSQALVDVPDPVLRGYLSLQLREPLTVAEMARVTTLEIVDNVLADLTGLDYAVNLADVAVPDNAVADVRPLAGLGALRRLNIKGNAVTDLTPLSFIDSLERLSLKENGIDDLGPLASLRNLRRLYVGGNRISDLGPLQDLTGLELLSVSFNQVADLQPLASLTGLTHLNLAGNRVSDVHHLSSLTGLTELKLDDNAVVDLQPLSGLSALTRLELRSNVRGRLAGAVPPERPHPPRPAREPYCRRGAAGGADEPGVAQPRREPHRRLLVAGRPRRHGDRGSRRAGDRLTPQALCLPPSRPRARAAARPGWVRSRISARSNSARAPKMWNTN